MCHSYARARRLKWEDVDFDQHKVYINDPEKASEGRSIKVNQKLIGMLQSLPRNPQQETIFNPDGNSLRSSFSKQRRRAAYKLQNPNLMKIHFHTFRHFFGTQQYHKTRDILHVKRLLGHRRIDNTLTYVHLVEDIDACSEDFFSATAKTEAEAMPLVEQGWQYVATTPQDVMLFRKRK